MREGAAFGGLMDGGCGRVAVLREEEAMVRWVGGGGGWRGGPVGVAMGWEEVGWCG